jgi:hypothetical protein
MPYFTASGSTVAALANGNAVVSIVPAAAANFKITKLIFGAQNAGGTITDFEIQIGGNRATARGTQTATATVNRTDPNSAASAITGVDTAWSVQPTLAATDGWTYAYNSHGGVIDNIDPTKFVSTVGTANPIVFIQRSGAALPANQIITWEVEWFE